MAERPVVLLVLIYSVSCDSLTSVTSVIMPIETARVEKRECEMAYMGRQQRLAGHNTLFPKVNRKPVQNPTQGKIPPPPLFPLCEKDVIQ